MLRTIVSWLLGLGSHAQLLRKLELDAEHLFISSEEHDRYWTPNQDSQPKFVDFGSWFPLIWRDDLALTKHQQTPQSHGL